MIKLVLKIKEENKKEFENIKATRTEVEVEQIGITPTNGEIEVCKILEERLGLNDKVQFINKTKKEDSKKEIENILKELFSI